MQVLIADTFEEFGIHQLREAGCTVTYQPGLKDDALCEAIRGTGCAVLIVRGTKVTKDALMAGDNLSLVVRAGAGYNTIDVQTASRRSIRVANCPGRNAVAVAELTFGLILALDRRIVENVVDLRNGKWNKKEYSQAAGLKGRILGILGLGQIGRAVAARARAFEMPVVGWSRSLTEEMAESIGVTRCDTPLEVSTRCDILSIHLAAATQTQGMVNAELLDRLKPDSYVVNTARADVVDYAALSAAVKQRNLRVAVDVFPDEPTGSQAEFHAEIFKAGGVVYGTHHIGASTAQAQNAIAAETVRIVTVYLRTGRVENCVNLCARSPARFLLVVRHRNRPGVLAHTLHEISHAGINVEEMENVICEGAESACAQIKLDGPPDPAVIRRIQSGNEHVLGVSLTAVE